LTRLALIHGWGFDMSTWNELRSDINIYDQDIADIGYFGKEQPIDCRDAVIVGHSHGVQRALAAGLGTARALIAINGFARFSQAPDYQPATPPRLIDRMIRRFDEAPEEVLVDFRRRCGTEQSWSGTPNLARLRAGLVALRDEDHRAELKKTDIPVLALFGARDEIVSPAMAAHALASARDLETAHAEDGGHLLPLSHPAWCAAQIMDFLARRGLS
jgi:pimeloyl-[acyl-carrier protein] methyl ester esterase